jgi:hypothetical protein
MRTRLWLSNSGSGTAVQYREDIDVRVWVHTNIGWVPASNLETESEAEKLASSWKLVEADEEVAREYL